MSAGEILLAGQTHFLRGTDESMPHQAVETFGAGVIEGRFEIVPEGFLPMRADGGKTFSEDEFVPIRVGGGGGLFYKKAVFIADAVPPGTRPEFAHGRVVETKTLLGVDWNGMWPAGFGMNLQ